MRTRTVCGVCFIERLNPDNLHAGDPWGESSHRFEPITVRVCEAGTCERLADVIDDLSQAFCSGHASTWVSIVVPDWVSA